MSLMKTALIIVLAIAYGVICWTLGAGSMLKLLLRSDVLVIKVDEDGNEQETEEADGGEQ